MTIALVTFNDIIEHLTDVKFGGVGSEQLRVLKRAVRQGVRQLVEYHDWRYYLYEHKLPLDVAVESTTATATYDHTGGTNEREVTISDTLVPSWLSDNPRHGRFSLASEIYAVDTYVSTTVFTLDDQINPRADVAATTDWTLYRNTYPLPDDFNGANHIKERNNPWSYAYVEPDDWHTYEQGYGNIGGPFYWTIMQDPDRPGGWVVRTVGYPTEADYISLLYQKKATDPTLTGQETKASVGTVTTNGTTTVTGSSTTFDSTMVGSVLRLGDASNGPTSPEGTNPAAQEHIIKAVASATSLTLVDAAPTLAGVKYTISSHLDIEHGAMENALLRSCEHMLAVMIADPATIADRQRQFFMAANDAKKSDSKLTMPRQSGSGYGPSRSLLGNVDGYNFGSNQALPGL